MRIGMVCYPTVGGSGVVATELGHSLAKKGHEIHFISYEEPFKLDVLQERIFFHTVGINQYALFKYPDYVLPLSVKIAEVSKKYQLDIIHVHYAIPHATSAFLAKEVLGTQKPFVVTTLHGTDITLVGRDPAYFEVVKHSIEKSDAVTAVSESLKQQTKEYFNIDCPINVIPNFIIKDPETVLFDTSLRESFVGENEKLLVHASNFRSVKRVLDVVRIFERVEKRVKAKLVFVGWGQDIDVVRQFVKEKQLEEKVFFVGKKQDIDPYLKVADLFLLPSSQESFGLVALEAMSLGTPVIASNAGGLPEVVLDGSCGFLSDVADVDQMAKNAIQLLENQKLYQTFSNNCIKIAKEKFNLEKALSLYESLYHKISS